MLALACIPPLLFALTGIIDTYFTITLRKKQTEGILKSSIATLMVIGGLVAFLFVIGIFCVFGTEVVAIPFPSILKIIGAGMARGIASYPYFKALYTEKIENITPSFQTIPLFSYIFANLLLGETLSSFSIFLMISSIITTGLFMWNFSTNKVNRKGIMLMLISAIFYALSHVGFKFGGEDIDNIRIIYFWNYIGVALVLLSVLLHRNIRNSSFQYFKKAGRKLGILNLGNEIFSIVANSILNFVALFFSVALVQTISNGLQPLCSFLLVFLAYKILPHIYIRKYTKKELLWKITLCIISFFLLFIFYRIS